MLFGNPTTLDRIILGEINVDIRHDLSKWANNMVETQYLAINRAAAHQKLVDEINVSKRQRDEPPTFSDGSLVLNFAIRKLEERSTS